MAAEIILQLVTYLLHNLPEQKDFYGTVFYSRLNSPTFSAPPQKIKQLPE